MHDAAGRRRHRLPACRRHEFPLAQGRDPRGAAEGARAREVPLAVGFLSGVPRQGRVGVGYSTIYGIEAAPAAEASLTVDDLDRAIAEVQQTKGSGSAAKRKQILGELLGRATDQEADFVKRLFTGELRQGALAGLMIDAVAKAAGVPGDIAAARADALGRSHAHGRDRDDGAARRACASIGFELFRPIFPMLASTAESVDDAVASFDRASVEWKLDGIRIQIHRRDDEVRIYTRNLNEITDALPGIVARGAPPAREASRVRRRGAVDGRSRPGRVPGHRLANRQRSARRKGS